MGDEKLTQFQRAFSRKGLFWVILFGSLILDIATKAWADATIRPTDPEVHTIIDGVIAFKWATNEGAAFSIFEGRPYLLATIASCVLLAVLFYAWRISPKRRFFLIALALVAGGAIGNLYDRMLLGHVRDFLYFPFDLPFYGKGIGLFGYEWKIPRKWPVFNVADMSILTGVGILIVISFREDSKKKKLEKPAEEESDDGS